MHFKQKVLLASREAGSVSGCWGLEEVHGEEPAIASTDIFDESDRLCQIASNRRQL